jgi:hypothetical protein
MNNQKQVPVNKKADVTPPKSNPSQGMPTKPAKPDGPMHAAKGNDDTMSQPQAGKAPTPAKPPAAKSPATPNGKKPS